MMTIKQLNDEKLAFGFIKLSEAVSLKLGEEKFKIMMTANLRLVKEPALVFIPKKGGFVWVPSHP